MIFQYIADRVWLIKVTSAGESDSFYIGGVTVKNNYILASAEGFRPDSHVVGRRLHKHGFLDLVMVYVRCDLGLMIFECKKPRKVKLKYAKFAQDEVVRKGEPVYHFGNPEGLPSSCFTSYVAYPCNVKLSHHLFDASVPCCEYSDDYYDFSREFRMMGDHFDSEFLESIERGDKNVTGHSMLNPDIGYYHNLRSALPTIQCANFNGGTHSVGGPLFREDGTIIGIFSHIYEDFDMALHVSVLKTFMDEAKALGKLPKPKGYKKTKMLKDKDSESQNPVRLVPRHKGVFTEVLLQVHQTFERFDASTSDHDDVRYKYFTRKMFPVIKSLDQGGVMVFINSDTELTRIRKFLTSKKASFCVVDESRVKEDISRPQILLYTERYHFRHRYTIRGIQELFFYSLPDRKEFYLEIVNMLEGADRLSCNILFSRFDKLRLEGIVGTETAKEMIRSEKKKFEFC